MEQPPAVFGEKLRDQVEGRLNFFDSGKKPQSNADAMKEALEQYYAVLAKQEKKAKKAKAKAASSDSDDDAPVAKAGKKKHRAE